MFLDFDDVICISKPYGGYEVFSSDGHPSDLWERLWHPLAIEVLRAVLEEFHPHVVITTSWLRLAEHAGCGDLGLRHLRTKPYTSKTNGKVERLVQTSLREWAYVRPYCSSALREATLQTLIHHYNWHWPHSALAHQPQMIRIPAVTDLMKLNI